MLTLADHGLLRLGTFVRHFSGFEGGRPTCAGKDTPEVGEGGLMGAGHTPNWHISK